jgi:phenylalanyl-tRNA synthetase beta chain
LEVAPGADDVIEATIPSWRRDLTVETDITEEIIRVHGYELVPPRLPHTPMPPYRHDPLELRNAVREALAGAGVTEVVTSALVSPRNVEQFPARDDGAPDGEPDQRAAGRAVTVTNPLSSQHAVLRQSLLGSLLEVVSTNLRYGRDDVAIFEVGKGYGATDDGTTHEWWRLGLALTGSAEPPAWNRPARPYDLDDAKGLIELVCRHLGFTAPTYAPLTDDPNLHPGRTARVAAGSHVLGRVGELHPATVTSLDLRAERVLVAELAVAGLAGGRLTDAHGATPPRHPAVQRDVAIVVRLDVPAGDVEGAIWRHGGPLLRAVALFDIYRGRPLDDAEKSLAYRLTLRDDERTLTESEVDSAVGAVMAGLAADIGARVRT